MGLWGRVDGSFQGGVVVTGGGGGVRSAGSVLCGGLWRRVGGRLSGTGDVVVVLTVDLCTFPRPVFW